MSPSVISTIRLAIRIAVVLPQPEGPTRTQISPAGTSRLSWSTGGAVGAGIDASSPRGTRPRAPPRRCCGLAPASTCGDRTRRATRLARVTRPLTLVGLIGSCTGLFAPCSTRRCHAALPRSTAPTRRRRLQWIAERLPADARGDRGHRGRLGDISGRQRSSCRDGRVHRSARRVGGAPVRGGLVGGRVLERRRRGAARLAGVTSDACPATAGSARSGSGPRSRRSRSRSARSSAGS